MRESTKAAFFACCVLLFLGFMVAFLGVAIRNQDKQATRKLDIMQLCCMQLDGTGCGCYSCCCGMGD